MKARKKRMNVNRQMRWQQGEPFQNAQQVCRNCVIFIRHYFDYFGYFADLVVRINNLSVWNLKGMPVYQRFVVFG